MKRKFKKAVFAELDRIKNLKPELIHESDIACLPLIVQEYIRYTGFMGKEKVLNFRSEFKGGIRFKENEPFMPLRSVQYNFMDSLSRIFYITAKKTGIPAFGLHIYLKARALFKVKVLGIFTVVDANGPNLDRSETVTILNDIFFMAPGALISANIQWQIINNLSVKAVYTNQDITVSAVLTFNEKGQLVNFMSTDRYETNGKEYTLNPWETPVTDYKEINGYRLPSKARLIYKRPEADFCYGEFELVNISYNCMKYVNDN